MICVLMIVAFTGVFRSEEDSTTTGTDTGSEDPTVFGYIAAIPILIFCIWGSSCCWYWGCISWYSDNGQAQSQSQTQGQSQNVNVVIQN